MISVIVPVYNIEIYLNQCVDSIINQTYKDIEIILVDDGSTDRSGEICDQYALKDNRIRVIHKTNGGLVSARKAGLKASTGEYVGYVDGDDWIENNMYASLLESIEKNSADFVVCNFYYDYKKSCVQEKIAIDEGRYDRRQIEKRIFPILNCNGYLHSNITFGCIWNKLYRRDILAYSQFKVPNNVSVLEDFLCTYISYMSAKKINIVDIPLYHYRQRLSSLSRYVEQKSDEIETYRIIYLQLVNEYKLKKIHNDELFKQFRIAMYNSLIVRSMELCPNLANRDELFPFNGVKKGSKVVLYGAGKYGQHLHIFLKSTQYYNLVFWTDGKFIDYHADGLPIGNPKDISKIEFDYIVIAILSINAYESIRKDLIQMGIPEKKICWVDQKLIEGDETWKMFGMPD